MMSETAFTHVFYPFLERNKDWIYDIYFTCRVPPFTQDAMGSIILDEFKDAVFENAMFIQETLGIKVSATFNNFNVSPKYENYKMFVENLILLGHSDQHYRHQTSIRKCLCLQQLMQYHSCRYQNTWQIKIRLQL